MDFFVYSRDGPNTSRLRDDLIEDHWSYMDRFADSMIARGPTLAADRETATGSLHVLGLPSVAAANEFVEREPNNRAGIYAEHSIWRFTDLLGRTMWEYRSGANEPRFLVIAQSPDGRRLHQHERPLPLAGLPVEVRHRLILYGALGTLDGATPVGVALALAAPSAKNVEALLEDGRLGLDAFPEKELHNWEFGGRR